MTSKSEIRPSTLFGAAPTDCLPTAYSQSLNLVFISVGYNNHCGHRHIKCYSEGDLMCADFVRDVRLAPELNSHLEEDINYMCTV